MASISFHGKPMSLKGYPLEAGNNMPGFSLTAADLSEISLSETSGIRVFLSVPSLDTPVCDLEVREFNKRAAALPGVSIYAVSMDLPFAQSRWCASSGVDAVKTLSDYKHRSFADATGTLINELCLHARAVFVVSPEGKVAYAEYVQEVSNAPDYDAAIAAVQGLL
jgi:thiol peroxidase